MYAITGATGQVGSVVAEQLLDDDDGVRVVVRDAAKGQAWARRGAEVAVADLADAQGLTRALSGTDGVFVMLPFDVTTDDFFAQTRTWTDAIATAVEAAGVERVVMLSSIGADLAGGTGPIAPLHDLEARLRATSAVVSAVRSTYFQEKVTDVLDAVITAGIYPVLGSADVARPMVATRDVGTTIADVLRTDPTASEVVDLDGPASTEREVAIRLGAILGTSVEVVTIPEPGWIDALVGSGLSPHIAEVVSGLHAAGEHGLLVPRGDRTIRCTTEIDTTLRRLVQERGAASSVADGAVR